MFFYWFFDYALQPLVSKSRFVNVIYLVLDSTASVLRLWTLPFNSSCSANMGVDDLLSCTCTQVIPPTLSTSTTTMNSPAEKLFYDVEGVTCWIIQHYSGGKCVKEQPKIMHTCVATADQRAKCWFLTSSKAKKRQGRRKIIMGALRGTF